jgi:hypothetical protein
MKVKPNVYQMISAVSLEVNESDYDIHELRWILARIRKVADEVEERIFDLEEPPEDEE